jgi:four helix bundle protein
MSKSTTVTQPAFIKNFKNMLVWQKSMELTNEMYKITATLPSSEIYHLRSQMLRATTSIGANLAEGHGQMHILKEINFYNNSLGSASEVLHWLAVALQNKYITKEQHDTLEAKVTEIIRMTIGYIRKLQEDTTVEN